MLSRAASAETAARAAPEQAPRAADAPIWPILLMEGGLLVLFGAIALAFPITTLFSLALAAGLLVIGDGLISLWRGGRRGARGAPGAAYWIARGIIALLLGVGILAAPLLATFAYSTLALSFIIIWLVVTGVLDLKLGLSRGGGDWAKIFWGVLLIATGMGMAVLMVMEPGSVLGIAWIVAVAALFGGLTMMSRSLLLRAQTRRRSEA